MILSEGPELDAGSFGLSSSISSSEEERLSRLYCGTTGLDCGGLESEAEQEWLSRKYEEIKELELEVSISLLRFCSVVFTSLMPVV